MIKARILLIGAALAFLPVRIPCAGQVRKERPDSPLSEFPEGKRCALSLSFDDGRPSQIENRVPLFDRYGVKATFYVNPDSVKKNQEGWKQAVAKGHEIGNHSMTHPCTGNKPFSRTAGEMRSRRPAPHTGGEFATKMLRKSCRPPRMNGRAECPVCSQWQPWKKIGIGLICRAIPPGVQARSGVGRSEVVPGG